MITQSQTANYHWITLLQKPVLKLTGQFTVNLEIYLVQLDDPGLRVAVVVEH